MKRAGKKPVKKKAPQLSWSLPKGIKKPVGKLNDLTWMEDKEGIEQDKLKNEILHDAFVAFAEKCKNAEVLKN
jgi:hypothetical protein